MSQQLWTDVDRYLTETLVPADPILEATMRANQAAKLPSIDVAPNQGKLLYLLARMQNARRILEIGTLGGYSTIWMARALPPDGRLISLEFDARHAKVAAANIKNAEMEAVVEIRVGPALESLPRLEAEGAGPFNLIFIDADKSNNPGYLDWAVRLSRSGTVILVDNVIRDGAVIDPEDTDPDVRGTRLMFERMGADSRLEATAWQTVGSKGYDGFAMARVK
jgi:predicted O-methyltransferase YrrM